MKTLKMFMLFTILSSSFSLTASLSGLINKGRKIVKKAANDELTGFSVGFNNDGKLSVAVEEQPSLWRRALGMKGKQHEVTSTDVKEAASMFTSEVSKFMKKNENSNSMPLTSMTMDRGEDYNQDSTKSLIAKMEKVEQAVQIGTVCCLTTTICCCCCCK